jgi:hypothetical protein
MVLHPLSILYSPNHASLPASSRGPTVARYRYSQAEHFEMCEVALKTAALPSPRRATFFHWPILVVRTPVAARSTTLPRKLSWRT